MLRPICFVCTIWRNKNKSCCAPVRTEPALTCRIASRIFASHLNARRAAISTAVRTPHRCKTTQLARWRSCSATCGEAALRHCARSPWRCAAHTAGSASTRRFRRTRRLRERAFRALEDRPASAPRRSSPQLARFRTSWRGAEERRTRLRRRGDRSRRGTWGRRRSLRRSPRRRTGRRSPRSVSRRGVCSHSCDEAKAPVRRVSYAGAFASLFFCEQTSLCHSLQQQPVPLCPTNYHNTTCGAHP